VQLAKEACRSRSRLSATTELGQSEVASWRNIQRSTPSLATLAVSGVHGRCKPPVTGPPRHALRRSGDRRLLPLRATWVRLRRAVGAGHHVRRGLVRVADLDCDPQELLHACGPALCDFDYLVNGQQAFSRTGRPARLRRSSICPRSSTASSPSCAGAPPDSGPYYVSSASVRGRWMGCVITQVFDSSTPVMTYTDVASRLSTGCSVSASSTHHSG
jgi:hypothetical protein